MKENVVNLDVAVSVDDIIRDGASMHAVNEVPLSRYPFRAGHHCHLVRKSHVENLLSSNENMLLHVKEYPIFRKDYEETHKSKKHEGGEAVAQH